MSAPAQSEPRSTFERVLARRSDDLSRSQAERAAELAQQGALQRARPRRVTLARVAGVAVALLFLRLVFCGTPGRRGNEPIGAAAVATADGAGVGASVSAFLPQAAPRVASQSAPAPTTSATGAASAPPTAARTEATPAPTPSPRAPATSPRTPRSINAQASTSTTPADSLPPLLATDDTEDDATVEVGRRAAAGAPSAPAVINIGTRLRATLEAPLRTGPSLAPATATLAEDVRDGERVLLAAGTRLLGSAFATPNDDRVQIVWRALVRDGRTTAIQAETLGPDGGPGLRGKVIRRQRTSVLRRVTSALAATAGEVGGYAVPLGDTALEQAGAAFAGRAGRELGQLGGGREWTQTDTVVELKAGAPIVVYVSADITLGASGAP